MLLCSYYRSSCRSMRYTTPQALRWALGFRTFWARNIRGQAPRSSATSPTDNISQLFRELLSDDASMQSLEKEIQCCFYALTRRTNLQFQSRDWSAQS
jgi:hypothetical protein